MEQGRRARDQGPEEAWALAAAETNVVAAEVRVVVVDKAADVVKVAAGAKVKAEAAGKAAVVDREEMGKN